MLSGGPLRKLDRWENQLSVPLATAIKGRHESVCVVCERLEYRKERSPRERDPCRARSCGTVQARGMQGKDGAGSLHSPVVIRGHHQRDKKHRPEKVSLSPPRCWGSLPRAGELENRVGSDL